MNTDIETLHGAIARTLRSHRRQRMLEALVRRAIPAGLLLAGGIAAAGWTGVVAWVWGAAAVGAILVASAVGGAVRRRESESTAALWLDLHLESEERCISALACLRGEARSALSDVIVRQAAERIRNAGDAAFPAVSWPRGSSWAAVAMALVAISALWPWTPRPREADRGDTGAASTPGGDVSTMLAALGPAAEHPALAEAKREAESGAPGGVRPSTAAAAAGALRRLDAVRSWADSLAETLAPAPSQGEAAAALDHAIDAARRGTLTPTNRAAAQVACPLPAEALSEFPACASAATRIEAALQKDDLVALTQALTALRDSLPAPGAASDARRLAEAFAAQVSGPSPSLARNGGASATPGGVSDAPGIRPPGAAPSTAADSDFILRSETSRAEAMRRHDWPEAYDDCVRRYFERSRP